MFTMPLVRRPTVSDLAGVCLSTMTVLGGERRHVGDGLRRLRR